MHDAKRKSVILNCMWAPETGEFSKHVVQISHYSNLNKHSYSCVNGIHKTLLAVPSSLFTGRPKIFNIKMCENEGTISNFLHHDTLPQSMKVKWSASGSGSLTFGTNITRVKIPKSFALLTKLDRFSTYCSTSPNIYLDNLKCSGSRGMQRNFGFIISFRSSS